MTSIVRIVVAASAGVAVSLAGAGTAAAAPQVATAAFRSAGISSGTYTPEKLTSFTWESGLAAWEGPSRNRLMRTTFRISGSTFTMIQPDGYGTLRGSIDSDGRFEASKHTSTGNVGTTDAHVMGALSDDSISLTYTSGATTAAVVNGTAYGESRTKAFQAELTVSAR